MIKYKRCVGIALCLWIPTRLQPLLFLRQFNIFKHGFNIIVGTQRHRRVHHITRQMRRETLNEIIHVTA